MIVITIYSPVLQKKGSENLSTPPWSAGDSVLVHTGIMWVWLTGRQQMEIISSEEMAEESGKNNDPQAERLSATPAVSFLQIVRLSAAASGASSCWE